MLGPTVDSHDPAFYNRPMQSFPTEPLADRPADGVEVVTFGCRLNAYESEVMRRHARAAGLGKAVVLNSCAVTAEAERQFRQAVRKARRDHPGPRSRPWEPSGSGHVRRG